MWIRQATWMGVFPDQVPGWEVSLVDASLRQQKRTTGGWGRAADGGVFGSRVITHTPPNGCGCAQTRFRRPK